MERGEEMTPAELMDSCCDLGTVPAYQNGFWAVTQEELEKFYRAAQAQALREAAGAPLKRRLQPQTMQRGGAQSHPPHACSCRCSPAPSA